MSIRPSIPDRKNKGRNATIIIRVALNIEALISREASKTTVNDVCLSKTGLELFWRNRLYTFSTSIIASSTSEPIAIAIPPRLIVLIFMPIEWSTTIAPSKESGIASNDIIVVLKLPRNKNKIIITKIAPSISADFTLFTEV